LQLRHRGIGVRFAYATGRGSVGSDSLLASMVDGWIGSIAAAWRPVSPARISLLAKTNSLFLITGNLRLWLRNCSRILALVQPREPGFGEFPCSFPIDQGTDYRDEFATDWFHRQLVCGCRDFAAGTRVEPRNPGVSAGFRAAGLANPNRRLRVSGMEDAAAGLCLCCQVGRFGFAPDSPQRRLSLGLGRRCAYAASGCRSASSTITCSWRIRKKASKLRRSRDTKLTKARMADEILRDISVWNESESEIRSGVSFADGREGQGGKAQRFQRGRILRTHRHPFDHRVSRALAAGHTAADA